MKETATSSDRARDAANRMRVQVERARRIQRQERLDRLRQQVCAALSEPSPIAADVYVFGSWATGTFDGQSDVDLLVIASDEAVARQAQQRLMEIGDDVLAFSAADWERRAQEGGPFFRRLTRERLPLTTMAETKT